MNTGISKSVGRYGINSRSDVLFIQSALNAYAKKHANNSFPLKVDGLCGNKTIQAIFNFQKNHVGIITPDARIDPNGRSFRHLTAGITSPLTTSSLASNNLPISAALNHVHVTYASDIKENRRIVSPYAINVVKLALLESGMTHAVITSTARTTQAQAEIMYKNAQLNLKDQYDLYSVNGDKVLDVYKNNKNKSRDEVIKLMKEKIDSFDRKGIRVSQHCVSDESYKRLNTFDIVVNSTHSRNSSFDKNALTRSFKQLEKQGFINKFIDETMKKNSCWHLEISPNAKDINLYK
ncbi:peptidoglycan-binding protein [Cellvibrio sp. NN19]|uniref:peptidoglycan-binding domain-containing protein n=1 Tax=Cellvibrio chitinivorans TaxID=3102792 RepID=UPI002B4043EE|nr:peptidoglycan-binding protein [Cellvibrio sp. NN19]